MAGHAQRDRSPQWQMRNYFNGLELQRSTRSEPCNTGIFKTSEWGNVSNQIACGVLWYPAIRFHPFYMLDYISPDDIPVISIHGDNDDIVPLSISQKIKDKCDEKGLTFEIHVIRGTDHGFVNTKWDFDKLNRKYTEQAIDITVAFLDKKLNNKQ